MVKVLYSFLAGLLFIGLVFLGVGGLGGGSFLESVSKESKGSSSYAAKVTAAKKRIKKNPGEASAWIALTEAQLHEADSSYESTTETYNAKGKEELLRAANSWNHYLSLKPKPPSVKLAKEVAVIFSSSGLDNPRSAVQALQIVIAGSPPSASLYSQLAEYSYLSGNISQGDLATKKAASLVPKSKRAILEAELERVKREVVQALEKAKAEQKSKGAATTTSGKTATGGAKTTKATATSSSTSSAAGKKK